MVRSKINTTVIADTSGLISVLIENDSNHEIATQALNKYIKSKTTIVTPSDVYSEFLNTVGKKFGRQASIEAAQTLNSNSNFLIVETLDCYKDSLIKFKDYSGNPSFTDCVVMSVADKYETKQIFGFDECFIKGQYIIPQKS